MKYATPAAFKTAVEERIKKRNPSQFARNRQLFIYSRFMARVLAEIGNAAILKGGLALELRLTRARTTKDIDLGINGLPTNRDLVLEKLQTAARLDLGDYLIFEVELDPEQPTIENEAMQYDGYRFRATCQLAGKEYGRRTFGIDVAFGDPVLPPPQQLPTEDWLDFLGIPPPIIPTYSLETHIAEKLHSYTQPRPTVNSRVKDLPDLGLLASVAALDADRVRSAIKMTFEYRKTHIIPTSLPEAPAVWAGLYEALAKKEDLEWKTLPALISRVRLFLEPVLQGQRGTWDPTAGSWTTPSS